ncbi:hypothetical protein BDV93DRAFT_529250 [Ceratobasidium sp. AG-I]|nr:hypothetical protein BDV93DRAFT_529250 [Ceratobasidium sp. AG-I]
MSRIANLIPIPGVVELEGVAKGFIALLKDDDDYTTKGKDLMEQLESMTKWACGMDNLADFTSDLRKIQEDLKAANKSKSQQRKLMIRDELATKLQQKMLFTTLNLVAQSHKALTEQTAGLSHQRKLIESHQITNDAEIHTKIWPEPWYHGMYPALKPVKATLRSGRFKKMEVSYLTFDEDSEGTAHKLVEEQVKYICQLKHVNVAKFVGVTEGFSGLDGIVVAMGGIDPSDFLLGSHSGAVWAKCIRGFEALIESGPGPVSAERITIALDGHVVIFPARSGEILAHFSSCWHISGEIDGAVKLLIRIYWNNYWCIDPSYLRLFVNALSKLAPGFTELQIMKIATDCGLFPSKNLILNGPPYFGLPRSLLRAVGDFGLNRKYVGWESFGRSRHVLGADVNHDWYSNIGWCKSVGSDGDEWLVYISRDPLLQGSSNDPKRGQSYIEQIDQPFRFNWTDLFIEAQEISRRLNVKLDDIHFVWQAEYCISLTCPEYGSWDEIPTTLYYHWSPQSFDWHERKGFYSAEKTPDCGAWQKRLESQGWRFYFQLHSTTYRMCDGWGIRYEEELRRIMAATPGSYPGAQIEEASY